MEPVLKILDTLADLVLILNREGLILFANKAFASMNFYGDPRQLIGLRPGQAIGCRHASNSKAVCGKTDYCAFCGNRRVLMELKKKNTGHQHCTIRHKSGIGIDFQVWASILDIGEENLSVLTFCDISHQKRRRALENTFFHDILNTAVGIRNFTELLKVSEPEKLPQLQQHICQLCDRLVAEIAAQRELLAAEQGNLKIHKHPMKCNEFIDEILEKFKMHVSGSLKALQAKKPDKNVVFHSDKRLLTRVLSNMLLNAMEASTAEDTVTLEGFIDEDHLCFSVHNPAIIPEDVRLRIFERSFSTKSEKRGFGTYGMKLLTENYLDGQLTFTSNGEQGTVFIARIPIYSE